MAVRGRHPRGQLRLEQDQQASLRPSPRRVRDWPSPRRYRHAAHAADVETWEKVAASVSLPTTCGTSTPATATTAGCRDFH